MRGFVHESRLEVKLATLTSRRGNLEFSDAKWLCNHVSSPVSQQIEEIQKRALESIGYDWLELRSQIREEDQEIAGSVFDGNDLEAAHAAISVVIPEMLYGSKASVVQRFTAPDCGLLDRKTFLSRFFNLDELCHNHFQTKYKTNRQDIRIASLPFAQINGVCAEMAERKFVTFLNEGLLYVGPELLADLLPLYGLSGAIDELKASGSDDAQAIANTILASLMEKHVAPMIDLIVGVLAGKVHPIDMRKAGKRYRPHANESWKAKELLREKVLQDIKVSIGQSEEVKLTQFDRLGIRPARSKGEQRRHFLAARGFFLFVLAHEFAHVYCDHLRVRQTKRQLRSPTELTQALAQLYAEIGETGLTAEMLAEGPFGIDQPIESEADAEGLMCVLAYCEDNELDSESIDTVLQGALSAFILMELSNRISMLSAQPFEVVEGLREFSFDVQNIAMGSEHPTPMSRIHAALARDNWASHAFRSRVLDTWSSMEASFEMIWVGIGQQISDFIQRENFKPDYLHDRAPLFRHASALGCYDTFRGFIKGQT